MIETGLHGKVVVVTGAAAGIGHATAIRFSLEGCHVAAWDVARCEHCPPDWFGLQVDVSDPAAVDQAAQAVVEKFGRIDVLVNNAGILRDGQLVKFRDGAVTGRMTDEDFNRVIDVNLKGVFHCTRAVVPHMIRQGGGVILNASSVVALYGNFGQTNYIASKAGVIGMTKVWARELGRYNIRVNAVAPGLVETDILKNMPEKVLEEMKRRTPLGRLGKPEEIAEAYVWLASSAAAFITGAVLSVDGGIVTGT
ncbi:MAG: 3-oxoacyl-[acyl-carrier-protein] reductase FabG [Bryobacteraceae bacterium]|nr:MAG: 3-oxoacyl-[acyl-carrier-protein] reductase FabG [Bryobacteraceae bacterium]